VTQCTLQSVVVLVRSVSGVFESTCYEWCYRKIEMNFLLVILTNYNSPPAVTISIQII
jgi:hypothetical protein